MGGVPLRISMCASMRGGCRGARREAAARGAATRHPHISSVCFRSRTCDGNLPSKINKAG